MSSRLRGTSTARGYEGELKSSRQNKMVDGGVVSFFFFFFWNQNAHHLLRSFFSWFIFSQTYMKDSRSDGNTWSEKIGNLTMHLVS